MATSIPPHNVAELPSTQHSISSGKPKAKSRELLKFVRGRTFTLAAPIVDDKSTIAEVYRHRPRLVFACALRWHKEDTGGNLGRGGVADPLSC